MAGERTVKISIQEETDVNTTTGETKEQMGRQHNDMKKLKIKNWTGCIQDRNKSKLYRVFQKELYNFESL
jgi:hypothetical protein